MPTVTPIKGKFRAQVRLKGHKHISRYFERERAAWAWARETEALLLEGRPAPEPRNLKTVGQLIEAYRRLRDHSRPITDSSTAHYTLKMLTRTLGDVVASRLGTADLVKWASGRREEGAGPYTINCDLGQLGTVLRYAGEGLPDAVGAARPKLRHLGLIGGGGMRERRPNDDEVTRLLGWLAEHKGQVYADFALFAATTAMRRGEVSALRWADLDAAKRMVLVRDRKDPRRKIGNDQWVPLLGTSWALVQRQPREGERIFPVHPQTMTKYFTQACRALDIPDLHLHDLRHEGISTMFEQGFTIPQVAIVSGHRDWRHLKRYTQIKPESLHSHDTDQGAPPRRARQPSAGRRGTSGR